MSDRFRGSAQGKVDDKGRLKIPTAFRRVFDDQWGQELFITSISGRCALLYPLPVWEEIEARLEAMPSTDRARARFLDRVSYFGQQTLLDGQGRSLLPQLLRERAELEGEVTILGQVNHLVVWNRSRYEEKLEREELTDEDLQLLAERGI